MVDLKLIRQLVRLMKNGGINDLEIDDKESGLILKLSRGSGESRPMAPAAPPVVQLMGAGPGVAAPAAPAPIAGGEIAEEAGLPPGTEQIVSPMVGTFYRSPSPDAEPFVEVGSKVDQDSVVCIVEAMKVMNEIKAEVAGEVVEILVKNGEAVEYGQPLLLVRTE